ncbi:MAG: TlpA family protein disulfide reductase [Gammaproteobacteria bacterium]|nr:MAG: TlpA family protein disulfide reductase [Gammaproteobacteria bacterium]
MKNSILFVLVLIVAGLAGFGLQRMLINQDNQNLTAELPATVDVIGQPRPEFALQDIEGKMRNISEWDGKVLLVNFWATWCPPCKKEIPDFMALQEQYGEQGFQIIGVAIDDEESVRDFADTLGMNYPVMAAELAAMEIARRYGNRIGALPFSTFVDRSGTIKHTKAGELSKAETEKIILNLL